MQEYENQCTAEAKFVKQLDQCEMILQAFEYEVLENTPGRLQDFYDSTAGMTFGLFFLTFVNEIKYINVFFFLSDRHSEQARTSYFTHCSGTLNIFGETYCSVNIPYISLYVLNLNLIYAKFLLHHFGQLERGPAFITLACV